MVPHQVHDPILGKEAEVLSQQQAEVAFLLEESCQVVLGEELLELFFGEGSGRFFGFEVQFSVFVLEFGSLHLLYCYLASPSELLAAGVEMPLVQLNQLWEEVVGQGLCSLVPRQTVLLLAVHHIYQKFLEQSHFAVLELPQSIEGLMGEQN